MRKRHRRKIILHWPIFVISLSDAYDRRENLLRQCTALGLTVDIIDAVDGRQGLPQQFEHKISRPGALARMGRVLTDAEFACALSHQAIYERVIEEDLPGAIVLEDDAILTDEFADFVRAKGYLLAPFIQLDHRNARYWPWAKKIPFQKVKLLEVAQNASLTTAYTLNKEVAQYIVSKSQPLVSHADWPCDMMPICPVVALPRLVTQPPVSTSQSTLERARLQSASQAKQPHRWRRFGRASYWRRWARKRTTRLIP